MPYPIGKPGQPWSATEKAQWRTRQRKQRSHADDVLGVIEGLQVHLNVLQYGTLDYPPDHYPLLALKTRDWNDALPIMLVTGGVHGYETSGVRGALQFAVQHAADYVGRANLIIGPCVSPWGYEHIQRWNANVLDPNRNFITHSPAPECAALMQFIEPFRERVHMHIDLHETTDSDESEFRPALAARDGKTFEPGTVPDGFYLCADREKPQPLFQQAVLAAVAKITHIAPADPDGTLFGSPLVAPGVIEYPMVAWGLCAGITAAPFRTTTEVYPDSPRATPEQCNRAQVAAACAAIDFALRHT